MSSENKKTFQFSSPDGSKMIELTEEELEGYKKCIESKTTFNTLVAVGGGIIASAATTVKASSLTSYCFKRVAIGVVTTSLLTILTKIETAFACLPVLKQILKSKSDSSPEFASTIEEKDEPSTTEELDFTPSISSSDFSSSINFGTDSSGGDRIFDKLEDLQESGDKAAGGKKRVTYDELWRRHRENSQARNITGYRNEKIDLGHTAENEPSLEKKKIRTNKYGDPLE